MKPFLTFIVFVGFFSTCSGQSSHKPNGYDVRLFEQTPFYDLAKAIQVEDTIAIKNYVSANKSAANFREKIHGESLLEFAIFLGKVASVKQMLALGADPNLRSSIKENTPFLNACMCNSNSPVGKSILELMIQFGADVNTKKVGAFFDKRGRATTLFKTPLSTACSYGSLDYVRLLVDNGADLSIYGTNEESLISIAGSWKLDIVKYLLVEKNMPMPEYCVIRQKGTKYEQKMTLLDLMNEFQEAYSPEQKKLKQEIIEFINKSKK